MTYLYNSKEDEADWSLILSVAGKDGEEREIVLRKLNEEDIICIGSGNLPGDMEISSRSQVFAKHFSVSKVSNRFILSNLGKNKVTISDCYKISVAESAIDILSGESVFLGRNGKVNLFDRDGAIIFSVELKVPEKFIVLTDSPVGTEADEITAIIERNFSAPDLVKGAANESESFILSS